MQVNEINKNQALQSASKSKASGQTTGASFSSYLEANMKVDNAPISSSALGVSATDALLAAQMVDGDEEKQKREIEQERANKTKKIKKGDNEITNLLNFRKRQAFA